MKEVKSNWIKWWKYVSIWKFFGIALVSIGISLGFALLIPNVWCLPGVFATCGVGGYYMRKLFPDVSDALKQELYK